MNSKLPPPEAPRDLPPVRIEFTGMDPAPGKEWCASCATRYMGELASNPFVKQAVKEQVDQAIADGRTFIYIELPESPFFPLRYGVAHAPSVIFPNQAFWTCWVHMLPLTPQQQNIQNPASPLIPGKDYRTKGSRRDNR